MNIGPGRPTEDGGPCSAGYSSTTTGRSLIIAEGPELATPPDQLQVTLEPVGNRADAGAAPTGPPVDPLAGPIIRRPAPRSSRSRRNYRRARAGGTAQGWPVPPDRFGIRWTSGALGPLARSSGISGLGGGDRVPTRTIPFQAAWGFRNWPR